MRIFDISITNFRGIRQLDNLKAGSINSFVGKNDAGKSSILRALDAFFNNSFSSNDVHKGIQDNESVVIQVRFETEHTLSPLVLDIDGKLCLRKQFSFTNTGRLSTRQTYVCASADERLYQDCWSKKEDKLNEALTALNIEHSRSGRGVTNKSKLDFIAGAIQDLPKESKEFPAKVMLENLEAAYDFFEVPEFSLFDAEQDLNIGSTDFQKQFKPIANQALENNEGLTQQIETNVVNELETEFGQIATLMQRNVPELERIVPSINCNWKNLVKFDLALKFSNNAFEIPISHKGTGFKRLLMVAYFEYLAQKQTKQYQIFGIEEPETYLHPGLQYDLLDSIIELSHDSQFFLTTHSPIFAGATNTSNIVLVKKQGALSTYASDSTGENVLDIVIEELGIRPDYNLLNDNYRKAIFVEGSGDAKFWKHAMTAINGDCPADILFIPCGGSQLSFFVNAELCRKINRRFIVIVDSDRGAIDYEAKLANQSQLRTKVENMGGDFQLLRKREIENYYHVDAISRILGTQHTLPPEFIISDYVDMEQLVKTHIIDVSSVNFKKKNHIKVFENMTPDEWNQVGVQLPNGRTDLEEITSAIVA